jgi:hypothetical protein
MRRLLVAFSACLLAIFASGISMLATAAPASASVDNDEFAFLDLVNQHRQAAGLPGLMMSTALSDAARAHSAQMAASGGIYHTTNLAAVLGAAAPNWRSGGENVGMGGGVSVLDTALMNSAPHRANILGSYNYVGIGVWYSGSTMYVTQMFVSTTTPIPVKPRPGSPVPIGSIDAVRRSMADLTVIGWALDPDTSASIAVHIYVDGAFAAATTANADRPDLARYGRGTAHGFSATIRPGPGVHTVCALALNDAAGVNPAVGCTVVNMASWPIGYVETAVQSGDGVAASGWTLDPDSAASTSVHMYVDGQRVAVDSADGSRPDIGAAYPGYGNAHGFSVRAATSPGWHSVCIWALNIGPGGNPQLSCRWVFVASDPFGAVDVTALGAGDLRVAGWTIDPSSTAAINSHIYVDGTFVNAVPASGSRPDLAGLGFGTSHGFDTRVTIDGGLHQLCVFGINVGAGANQVVRCLAISVPSDPVGALDDVSVPSVVAGASGAGSSVTAHLAGWAIDPNTSAAVDVRIIVDGSAVTTVHATDQRPDLAPYYPGFGTAHGFSAAFSIARGSHTVCAVAVNARAGTDRLVGCANAVF